MGGKVHGDVSYRDSRDRITADVAAINLPATCESGSSGSRGVTAPCLLNRRFYHPHAPTTSPLHNLNLLSSDSPRRLIIQVLIGLRPHCLILWLLMEGLAMLKVHRWLMARGCLTTFVDREGGEETRGHGPQAIVLHGLQERLLDMFCGRM